MKLDFIGVGAEKCGTTWLSKMLMQHPQISFIDIKDAGFLKNPNFDLFQYTSHFNADGNIHGDWSVQYFNSELASNRIKDWFPDAKILISLRDPVDRFISAYNYHKHYKLSIKSDSISELIDDHHCFLYDNSFYYDNIRNYVKNFQLENIKFIIYDDIMSDKVGVLKGLYRFVGAQEAFLPDEINQRENAARRIRYKIFDPNYYRRLYPKISDHMIKFGLYRLATRIAHYVRSINVEKLEKESIDEGDKIKLRKMFVSDIRRTENLINKDLSHWIQY